MIVQSKFFLLETCSLPDDGLVCAVIIAFRCLIPPLVELPANHRGGSVRLRHRLAARVFECRLQQLASRIPNVALGNETVVLRNGVSLRIQELLLLSAQLSV